MYDKNKTTTTVIPFVAALDDFYVGSKIATKGITVVAVLFVSYMMCKYYFVWKIRSNEI